MTETMAVLFIFFILVGLGIVFYYKYSQVALKQEHQQLLAARAMDTTLRVLFLPEFLCTKGEAEPDDNCIDVMKLNHLDEIISKNQDYYYNIFTYSKVSVQELYPGNRTWTIYEKEKPEGKSKEPTYFVVALRDDIAGQYGFGYITVEVYS